MPRMKEVKWNSLGKRSGKDGLRGTININDPLPVIREYEENGITIKVYPPSGAADMQGEHGYSANVRPSQILYPAS